jgi:hypothetical protein
MAGNKLALAIAAGAFTTSLVGGVALAGFQPFAGSNEGVTGGPTAAVTEQDRPTADKLKTILDGLVAKNTITRAQADAILQAVKDAAPTPKPHAPSTRSFVGDLMKATTDYLGMDLKALSTELRGGKSVAEVADGLAAKGKSAAELANVLTQAANVKIDQAVTANKLTAVQAADLKPKVATEIKAFIQRKFTKPALPLRPNTPVKPISTPKS